LHTAILNQLTSHLSSNKCFSKFQSAYRRYHSTETALCRIYNDLLFNIKNSSLSLLILLDLSAAFDTIDFDLLVEDLFEYGFRDDALKLLESYLKERFQKVSGHDSVSDPLELFFGVPQGSVLGPVLFSLYTFKLARILEAHGVNYHFYADDTQIYMPISDVPSAKNKVANIMNDIKLWMHERKLKLNEGKTEVIVINGPLNNANYIHMDDTEFIKDITPSNNVRNLGLIIDNKLSLKNHFNSVIKSCNFQLRKLSLIIKYLNKNVATTLVHAFITSRVDYCNSLFVNLPNKDLARLQSVLNRAACLIYQLPPFTSISSYLFELHWLPVKARIEFKICLLVFNSLKYNEPAYLNELFIPYTSQSNAILRSADDPHLLTIPRLSKHSTFASRAISYAGPMYYNKLPSIIKNAENTDTFKKLLKTHLFRKAYDPVTKCITPEYKV